MAKKKQSKDCKRGAHPKSTWVGPGRWKCDTCEEVWYGPSY